MIKKQNWIVTAALLCIFSPNCLAETLKVFMLAGQSNMEGRHAGILTLDQLGEHATIVRKVVDNPKVPHGFLVLALCEALRGDADSDSDGLVTIGELFEGFPPRATDLARGACEQDAVVVLPADLAKLPLARALLGKHEPLWTAN